VRLLAVDTALGACSVALLEGDAIVAHAFEAMERGHAECLAPMVDQAMRGTDFSSLDRLAVTTGPGTFTGQRVGLSFMRGLRLALGVPLVGVTTLEAIGAAAMAQTGRAKAAVIHDARRQEAYLLLQNADQIAQSPALMNFADAVDQIRSFGPCVLAGTGALAAGQMLGSEFFACGICQPDALWVAKLAQSRQAPHHPPGPLYLRAPDAKLPGGKSVA
jgi:tRNA threonylcarbamoyladenosine biosynthesis protein TsaB